MAEEKMQINPARRNGFAEERSPVENDKKGGTETNAQSGAPPRGRDPVRTCEPT